MQRTDKYFHKLESRFSGIELPKIKFVDMNKNIAVSLSRDVQTI